MYKKKNLRTFPKLVLILNKYGYLVEVEIKWEKELERWRNENGDGKYMAISGWSFRMRKAMKQDNLVRMFDIYNGKERKKKNKVYQEGLR